MIEVFVFKRKNNSHSPKRSGEFYQYIIIYYEGYSISVYRLAANLTIRWDKMLKKKLTKNFLRDRISIIENCIIGVDIKPENLSPSIISELIFMDSPKFILRYII